MAKKLAQLVLLFESTPQSDSESHLPWSFSCSDSQMESWEGILYWMAVLWERGFSHENPQGEY